MPRPTVRAIRSTIPWSRLLTLARAAPLMKRHWDKLTPAERRQLQRLVRKSRGRPSNLSVKERLTVRRLVRKLELPELGRGLVGLRPSARPRKRRSE